jgi:hypothetical protein
MYPVGTATSCDTWLHFTERSAHQFSMACKLRRLYQQHLEVFANPLASLFVTQTFYCLRDFKPGGKLTMAL